jgi:hypothetical protein
MQDTIKLIAEQNHDAEIFPIISGDSLRDFFQLAGNFKLTNPKNTVY